MKPAGNAPDERLTTQQIVPPGTGPIPAAARARGPQPGVQPAPQGQRPAGGGYPAGDARPTDAGLAGEETRFSNGTVGSRGENEPSPVKSAGGWNRPRPGREPGAALLDGVELQRIVIRWKEIQAHFVDEPKTAVERADALVADLMQQLAVMFDRERTELEQRWADGDEASTEELRQSLRRYRSLFERLLNA